MFFKLHQVKPSSGMMKLFKKNIGTVDRLIRLVVGIALVTVGLMYFTAPVSYVIAVVGLIVLVTVLTGSCALYSLLGINTLGKAAVAHAKKKHAHAKKKHK